MIACPSDNTLKVWDLETGLELRTLRGHTAAVNGVSVSPDGRRAVSASSDKTLRVWRFAESRPLLETFICDSGLYCCSFINDRQLISGEASGSIDIFQLEEPSLRTVLGDSSSLQELEGRWAKLRSHKRAVASLHIVVEWEDGNIPRRANGVTVDVSASGCMAVVGADLPLRKRLRLIRPENGRAIEAEVVWRGAEAWDVGLAFVRPDPSFWAVPI